MEPSNSAKVVIEIPNVQVFRLLEKSQQKLAEGTIKLCLIESQGVHFITVDSFFQDLKKQIVYVNIPFDTQITYLIPHQEQGFVALVVSRADSNYVQLNNAFSHLVTMISKEAANANESINASIFAHCPTVFTTPIIQENKAAYFLNRGGIIAKSGLTWFGSVLASGVNQGGDYLSSKITSTQNVEVSDSTKGKVNNVKETTQSAYEKTTGFLGNLIKPVVEQTNEITDSISQKIDQSDNTTIQYMQEVGKATVNFTSQTFDGLSSGFQDFGGALSNNTQKVVQKQYGQEVTTTFLGSAAQINHDEPGFQPHHNNGSQIPPIQEVELSENNQEKENLLPKN